jgi:hypothetical protein
MARQGSSAHIRRRGAIALTVAAALVAAPAGTAAPREHVEFALDLTSAQPASATGMHLRAGVPDRNGKPPQLRRVVYQLPAGTVLDPTVVPACQASDDELRARGLGACPAETRVGHGTLTAVTGFGAPLDPLAAEVTVFQGVGELVEAVTPPGSDRVVAVDRARIGPGTLTLNPPEAPGGPPDGRTTIRDIDLFLPERSADGRSFLGTPPGCPGSGNWVSRVTATYDGGETEAAAATTPCRIANAARSERRLRLSVFPRRVVVGRRVRFRVRVSGPSACVAAAVVRFPGHARSVGREGRGAVKVRFTRAGRRRATVSASGCRPAGAWVRVLSRSR